MHQNVEERAPQHASHDDDDHVEEEENRAAVVGRDQKVT